MEYYRGYLSENYTKLVVSLSKFNSVSMTMIHSEYKHNTQRRKNTGGRQHIIIQQPDELLTFRYFFILSDE